MIKFSFQILQFERNFIDPADYDIENEKYFLQNDAK